MRTKKVIRYWCDFCNKAGLQARATAMHEKHCTLNPNRSCRVCGLLGSSPEPVAELVALLPDASAFNSAAYGPVLDVAVKELTDAIRAAMPALREATANCPACIMAALRQAKIPVPLVDDFDFKTEMNAVFDSVNDERF